MLSSFDLSAMFSAAVAAMFFYAGRRLPGRPEQFWLAAGCALLAGVWATKRWHPETTPFSTWPLWHLNAVVCLAMAAFSCGMLRHLGLPRRAVYWLTFGICSFTALYIVASGVPGWITDPALRLLFRGFLSAYFVVIAVAAFWAQRREPGLGHAAAGVAALLAPALAVSAALLVPDYTVFRNLGIVPFMLMVLAVIPAGYIREHRRLLREQAARGGVERELRDQQAVLQVVGDASPDSWVLLDTAGRVVLANAAVEALFGVPRRALLGQALESFFQGADRAWLRAELEVRRRAVNRSGAESPRLTTLCLPDQVCFPVRAHFAAMEMSGQHYRCLYLVDLRPELQRTEELATALTQARASSEAKTRFLATMSHEIRTPLNGLSGMLDLLGKSAVSSDQRSLLNAAGASARHLRAMLNDLLDMSKIEAGRLELEDIAFDLHAQLDHVLSSFSAVARARGLSLDVTWNTSQTLLSGDPHRIVQVLSNLLDNAVKFTDAGGVSVEVGTRQLDTPDERCELRVSVVDTGIGVPADRLQAIFEPFTQADTATARLRGGSGLGLALCRQLCRQMGGDVTVASRPEGGSVFSFTVVCGPARGAPQFQDTRPMSEHTRVPLAGVRVLIVDDNNVNQLLLKRWLRAEGMRTHSVGDGAEAVKAVCSQSFDVVLMDISMPVMNGLDATRAIRALDLPQVEETSRFPALPIIGISAHAMSGDRERCLEAGMNDYVTKPIDRVVLLDRIAQSVDGVRLHA